MMSSYQCGLPEKAIAVILRQLLDALSYLHAQRIIHRSIRANHILVDSKGGVRLTGFRLARRLAYGEKSTTNFDNHLESSLLWLAPEVLGQDLSGYTSKADIYSVGATLCEMANGFPPFGDMNRLEMLYEKSRGTTPRLLDSTTLPSFEGEENEHCSLMSIRANHILVDAKGGVRLTGFRLARRLAYGEKSTTNFDNHLESSLLWLAPEVLGQDLSGYTSKADIYSVGATLCEMANGFPPFGDMNRLEMLYEKSRGTTPRLLDSTTLPSFEEPSEHSKRTFTESFHNLTGLCLKANPANRPDANSLLSHPFLKKTRKSLIDLMPLAQKLEQVQRVSGKTNTVEENKDVPEWIF
ncbi:hypothetical protein ANCCAN_21004 [Ancylostoma caninum]|uniref:Protein kinase domain-containing protein n=1 Tax=Ancylostoma caninum TaxID=29170 RepID=A0A368FLR0_ANCCA|nr:hypothetical protein ANCCAN_21004 [Ancylostoma caninum]